MILTLFAFFVGISLVMITIGLSKPTESAQALIGFTFLFLLALVLMGNNLEYKTGEQQNTTYSYIDNTTQIDTTSQTTSYIYENYDDSTGWFNTHTVGFYMAVASIIGFIGVLISLKGGWKE